MSILFVRSFRTCAHSSKYCIACANRPYCVRFCFLWLIRVGHEKQHRRLDFAGILIFHILFHYLNGLVHEIVWKSSQARLIIVSRYWKSGPQRWHSCGPRDSPARVVRAGCYSSNTQATRESLERLRLWWLQCLSSKCSQNESQLKRVRHTKPHKGSGEMICLLFQYSILVFSISLCGWPSFVIA